MSNYVTIMISLIVFLPTVGALVLAFFPKDSDFGAKRFALLVTIATFLLTVLLFLPSGDGPDSIQFHAGTAGMQNHFSHSWIPTFDIDYRMGMDGISFPLVILTSVLSVFSMGAAWGINKHVKAFCMLFLLLETGMLGVFLSLDFFLFFVFWEVMLLPMYFLIGVWGGPRREYAAIKFFLYTMLGGVFMLIAILMLYFASDVMVLTPQQLAEAKLIEPISSDAAVVASAAEVFKLKAEATGGHTFNILALQQMGQHTDLFRNPIELNFGLFTFTRSLSWWAFLLLFVGFIIKVPSVPFHTWLPDAHVEAPTPISMILAGVLLKMGGYGILRICYPIFPDAAYSLAYFVCGIGVLSMLYGAFAAMAQKDFKRLVAYSSVSHMGYVVLGLGVASAVAGTDYNSYYWQMGVNGAMFQMIGHGISSAGMFFIVGVIYDRVHHRNLDEFGGLFAKMPVYSGLAMGIFFAGLGLPGLCGFIGEVLVTLSVWNYSQVLAILSAFTVILTASYILWTLQRVYLGAEYKGPHAEALVPIKGRELAIAAPLLGLAILFGVYPRIVFDYMSPTIEQEVNRWAEWRQRADENTPPPINAAAKTDFDPDAVTQN